MKDISDRILSDDELSKVSGGNDGMGISAMKVSVTTEDWPDTLMVVTNAAGANVRMAPIVDEVEGRVLFCLSNGAQVIVNGKTSNGWYRVKTTDPVYGGECFGYISRELLGTPAGPGSHAGGPVVVSDAPYFR